jgi:hypothetical protein
VIGIAINGMIYSPRPMVKSESPIFNWQIRLELLRETAIRSSISTALGTTSRVQLKSFGVFVVIG